MGKIHQVSPRGVARKGFAELDQHLRNEHKEVRDGVTGEGQGLSEEDESRMNETGEDLNDGSRGTGILQAHQTSLQKQQPKNVWERFLPVRTLKVLLVENDDSTRQVVSALLRNCHYEVTAAANVLQAWKILEDLTNHIDLVLAEVSVPSFSGIGLLCKIMSHKTCKNIPVIMMSSNDSMPTVFKCLSKGAVDFLVKPIRKNELKNLWQHVWRRCHSSIGSGSESGTENEKLAKSTSPDDSDNNIGSNDGDDNGIIGLNISDGSDNGSGTQSSWTKRPAEVDSPQPVSPTDQPADLAQVVHSKTELFCNGWVPMTTNMECQEQNQIADDFMGKDLEIGVPTTQDTPHESYPIEKVPKNKGVLGFNTQAAADSIGIIDRSVDGSTELPSLKLGLKRLGSSGEGGIATHDDRNVVRRSNLSAFSRYHTPKQGLNVRSDNNDMGSTTQNAFTKPAEFKEKTVYASLTKSAHTSAFHPVQKLHTSPQVMHPDCGSLVRFAGLVEGNALNCSLNGSNSGSNQGSNGQNGSSTGVNGGGVNGESGNGITEGNRMGGGNGSGSSSGVDQNRSAQREAALNKFRQKRKERNFQKKVRYQSRKRLAEKRPRVRGQFVRRALFEHAGREVDS